MDEKKAKKAHFFQSYGRSPIAQDKQYVQGSLLRAHSEDQFSSSETQENLILPNEEIHLDPPATD